MLRLSIKESIPELIMSCVDGINANLIDGVDSLHLVFSQQHLVDECTLRIKHHHVTQICMSDNCWLFIKLRLI